jgi:pyrimidine dimer DNA glycosylase
MRVLMPYTGQQASARAFDDDGLLRQIDDLDMVCQMMADAGPATKLLVVRQWRGYEGNLALYLRRLVTEARLRGLSFFADQGPQRGVEAMMRRAQHFGGTPLPPAWVGAQWWLQCNRSVLLRQDPGYYAQRFPDTPVEMPYLYPQGMGGRYDYTVTMTLKDRHLVESGQRAVPAHLLTHQRVKEMYPV